MAPWRLRLGVSELQRNRSNLKPQAMRAYLTVTELRLERWRSLRVPLSSRRHRDGQGMFRVVLAYLGTRNRPTLILQIKLILLA